MPETNQSNKCLIAMAGPVTIEVVHEVDASAIVIPRKQQTVQSTHKQLDKKLYHACLADYYQDAAQHSSERRARELPWQLSGAKDYFRLQQVLAEPR